ncbi:NADP-dependent alcohol dehydrogenase [Sporothrix schenckii 1099-18]|uniref:NADP-dependent alcohol dehydrogenase n=1 Tax=Sporothrix schenckii 1099-18 TaxID=1397361 RepID=A0A0F2LYY0_SPOSC|nr:NADP-dependent alcohol dehydrogenase [Sporothrix schenckii 1099-18]KJR82034.1 NADP-dependent alcohol dehydrogenase [Sporothrix schenckii 1099-18]
MDGETRTYLAGSPSGALQRRTALIALGALEVLVRITHSGVCGTDVHDRTASCGLGHEGVGVVHRVGSEVTAVQVGQRVGLTFQTHACGSCPECIAGYRQYCHKSVGQKYGAEEHGTFCDYAVRHQDFVNPIPDGLPSNFAAPLVCAGITVYEALRAADVTASDRVGVVGLGGLGHFAVLYAKAMGCAVSVFSASDTKRADALAMGASAFHVLNTTTTAGAAGTPPPLALDVSSKVDVLLLCGGAVTDFGVYVAPFFARSPLQPVLVRRTMLTNSLLPLLARRARVVPVVIQTKDITVPYMPFILPGMKIIFSLGATRQNEQDALKFAARHNIRPWIQEYPMSEEGLTEAFVRLADGTMRYRAVLSKELGNAFSA